MTDEVSESMRLGVLTFIAAALLSSVLTILITAISLLNGFGAGVNEIANNAQNSQILSLTNQPYVSGPVVYTAVLNSIDSIDVVVIAKNGKVSNIIWNKSTGEVTNGDDCLAKNNGVSFDGIVYRLGGGYGSKDSTSYLFTQCAGKFYKVHVSNGVLKNTLKTVILEEVEH